MFFNRLLFKRFLDRNEVLFYSIHRHWILLKDKMFKIAVFGYAVPIALLVFVFGFFSPASYLAYGWLGIALLYTVYVFCDWYLDAWLITNISIISTAWDGFLKQRSSRIDYESIESVDIEKKGVKQMVFNFGHIVLVRNSGINVTINHASSPQLASAWITRVMSEVTSNKRGRDSEALKGLLAEIIQDHIRINS